VEHPVSVSLLASITVERISLLPKLPGLRLSLLALRIALRSDHRARRRATHVCVLDPATVTARDRRVLRVDAIVAIIGAEASASRANQAE
jgi:hypothetical protein